MGEDRKTAGDLQSILFELSHEDRIRIIKSLGDKPAKLTQLSKELGINTVEASRHLSRLVDANLVERGADNQFHLTNITPILLGIMDRMDFVVSNREFFIRRDIMSIPYAKENLGAMYHARIVDGFFNVVTMTKQLTFDAEKFINTISTQPMKEVAGENRAKADFGVAVRIIYPAGMEVPKEYAGSKVKVRFHPSFNFSMKMCEKWGGVVFPDSATGKADFSQALVGEDEMFVSFLSKIFEKYWDESRP